MDWHVDLLGGAGRVFSLMDLQWVAAAQPGVRFELGNVSVDWQAFLKNGHTLFEHDLTVSYSKGPVTGSFSRFYYMDGERDYWWSVDTVWRLK